jgi:hypothetical protein
MDILTNILILGMYVYMYLFMYLIIKLDILGIQEQRNMSLTMPCRQGLNLGLRECILNTLYVFELSIIHLQCLKEIGLSAYSTQNRPEIEYLLRSNLWTDRQQQKKRNTVLNIDRRNVRNPDDELV